MPLLRPFAAALGVLLSLVLLATPVGAYHGEPGTTPTHAYANDDFWATWARTDRPVADDLIDRTWMWGPEPYTQTMMEEYAQGPGGIREVQYFDKSRMEITDPGAPNDRLWYVTNGLLVVEMVNGWYQVGDDQFNAFPEPADVPIAGDPDSGSPTYADISAFGLMDVAARNEGTLITEFVDETGIGTAPGYGDYGVTAEFYVPETDHTVASVFWDFMHSEGLVFDVATEAERTGQFVAGELFPNAFYATGYPITEAYWTTANLQGTPTDILWQCFERRCLTYTPTNPAGFLVEAGNVGQHYYNWRYAAGAPTVEANIYLVDIENTRGVAETFGCNDSLVPLAVPIVAVDSTEANIVAALESLLGIGETETWYNSLRNTDLMVDSVSIENGTATVHLVGDFAIGGVCDNPRVEEQLEQTVLQFDGVNDVVFYLNDRTEPLLPITGA